MAHSRHHSLPLRFCLISLLESFCAYHLACPGIGEALHSDSATRPRYKGKGMALVGWEIDQVRRTATGDVSVPISATYNHHYVSQMIGAGAKFKKVMLDGPDDPRAADLHAHGRINLDQPHYVAEKVRNSTVKGATVHTICSSANGGEYRKSFHGFAPGHALVIESPTELQITPMQVHKPHLFAVCRRLHLFAVSHCYLVLLSIDRHVESSRNEHLRINAAQICSRAAPTELAGAAAC